jgi:2'-5' RNA ligase
MRCFIAVELPKEAKEKVALLQKAIKSRDFFDKKFTEEENLHLTIKFLGEIDEEKTGKTRQALRTIKFSPFTASAEEFGVFSKQAIRIVWLKISGADELQKKVDEVLSGLFEKEKRFMGHLTIARPKKINQENKEPFLKLLSSLKTEKLSFRVNSFALFKSELKKEEPYTKIEEFYL